ncbi:hypothetical protein C9J48_06865 [Photobacterium profundum]|uniref:Uncharacterized protein n=1 Tax=Photobacterium profundum 3TCK TaxID=314280 RepID=Q1ZA30_9GAMM|nr:hypothetical protein [Photobacterium profundum]EAS45662.1 hypothetical protein P3TCK_04776 [Photobacterium profundum 3TCK]PSV63187.1 hypothetical protein C9J48_06865 [Photobacterium profundum]
MRKNLTFVFYCVSTVLIIAHLWDSFVTQNSVAKQNKPLYIFSIEVETTIEPDIEIDYQKVAAELSELNY